MQYFTMARQKVFFFYLCVQFLSPSFISTKRCCNIIVSPVWGDFVFTRVNFPRVCLCRKHTRGCASQPCRMPRVFVRRLFSRRGANFWSSRRHWEEVGRAREGKTGWWRVLRPLWSSLYDWSKSKLCPSPLLLFLTVPPFLAASPLLSLSLSLSLHLSFSLSLSLYLQFCVTEESWLWCRRGTTVNTKNIHILEIEFNAYFIQKI